MTMEEIIDCINHSEKGVIVHVELEEGDNIDGEESRDKGKL